MKAYNVKVARDDVVCPACEYSLRGLPGDQVACPECGEHCDIAKLMTRAWKGPWWKAPGYPLATAPCAMFVITPLATIFATESFGSGIGLATFALFAFTWVGTIAYCVSWFHDMLGLWLSIGGHLVYLLYLGGPFAALEAWVAALDGTQGINYVIGVAGSLVGIALMVVANRVERAIGEACIRHHLRHGSST